MNRRSTAVTGLCRPAHRGLRTAAITWFAVLAIFSHSALGSSETSQTRGLLGLMLADFAPAEGEEESEFLGSEVMEVTPGLPAARSGIREGDVILAIDGRRIKSTDHLQVMISEKVPGSLVEVMIARPGGMVDVTVRITSWEAYLLRKPTFGLLSNAIELKPVDAELRDQYLLPKDTTGLLVLSIDDESIYRNVLSRGTVIVRINEKPVNRVEDVIRLLQPGLNRLEILEDGVVGSMAINGF